MFWRLRPQRPASSWRLRPQRPAQASRRWQAVDGRKWAVVAVVAMVLNAACAVTDDTPTVFAASSLGGWLDTDAAPAAQWSFAGSDTLVSQLLAGADADILITANRKVATPFLDQSGPARAVEAIATNRLVVAVPIGNPGNVQTLQDLSRPELDIAVCAAAVPCGSGLDGLNLSVDSFESSARAVLTKVELNELDAGLVYVTDAISSDLVEIAPIELDVPEATYWAFTLNESERTLAFRQWLTTDGAAQLQSNGFVAP